METAVISFRGHSNTAAGGKFRCLIELQKGTLKNGKKKTEMAGRRLFWHSHRR